ncbi:unnamed protein product [Choristocarpus tenellus]
MIGVGNNLEKLSRFSSTYRRREGDRLGTMDEGKVDTATRQILSKGRRVVHGSQDTSQLEFDINKEKDRTSSGYYSHEVRGSPSQTSRSRQQLLAQKDGLYPRSSRDTVREDIESAPRGMAGTLEQGLEETTRLCEELMRWSSALDGAEEELRQRENQEGEETHGDREHDSHSQQAESEHEGFRWQEQEQSSRGKTRWDWRKGEPPPGTPQGREEGVRGRCDTVKLDLDPTPSYALPTKHFKSLNRDSNSEDINHGGMQRHQNKLHRQAILEEENRGMKLRMEGQRRAIHELEHQARSLRGEVQLRDNEIVKLRRKIAMAAAAPTVGTCSCCTSTHGRGGGGGGDIDRVASLKKKALAAEAQCRDMELLLLESRGKEQRTREINNTLKKNLKAAQQNVSSLEVELKDVKNALAIARKGSTDLQREAKASAKDARKFRRQHEDMLHKIETARAEAAELSMHLKNEVVKGGSEAGSLREKIVSLEAMVEELSRENHILEDRLREGQLRGKMNKQDRWVMSELRSKSSPPSSSALRRPLRDPLDYQSIQHSSLDWTGRQDVYPLTKDKGRDPTGRLQSVTRPSTDQQTNSPRDRDGDEVKDSLSSPDRGRTLSSSPSFVGNKDVENDSDVENGLQNRETRSNEGHVSLRRLSTREERFTREKGQLYSQLYGSNWTVDGEVVNGSLPAGSDRSAMGARYNRLQAMYRRVNRKDRR